MSRAVGITIQLAAHQSAADSTVLPWMDRVFSTYYLPRDRWPDEYGIDDALPDDLAGQLLHPLHGPEQPAEGVEVR